MASIGVLPKMSCCLLPTQPSGESPVLFLLYLSRSLAIFPWPEGQPMPTWLHLQRNGLSGSSCRGDPNLEFSTTGLDFSQKRFNNQEA